MDGDSALDGDCQHRYVLVCADNDGACQYYMVKISLHAGAVWLFTG